DGIAVLADGRVSGQRQARRDYVVARRHRHRDGEIGVVHAELGGRSVGRGGAEVLAYLAEGGGAGLGERVDQGGRGLAGRAADLAEVVGERVGGLRQGERGRRVDVGVDRGAGILRQQRGTRHDLEG